MFKALLAAVVIFLIATFPAVIIALVNGVVNAWLFLTR